MTLFTTLRLGAACLAIFFITSCNSEKSNQSGPDVTQTEADTSLPTAQSFFVTYDQPQGWVKSIQGDLTIFTAPEENAFLIVQQIKNAVDAKDAARQAWKNYDADFSRNVRLNTPRTAGGGWEQINGIEYETSPAEEHVAFALAHRSTEDWMIALTVGNVGTFAKRGAAINASTASMAVGGYEAEDLSTKPAKTLTPERVKELVDFVAQSAEQLSIPGVGFALIQNGEILYEGGVGVRANGRAEPITKDTRFMIASNTKGMTTLLLSKLVEMDKLAWDDKVIDHYPAFRLGDDETTNSVLIRHLVCACTGLPRKDLGWIFNNEPDTPASTTFDDLATTAPTSGFGKLYQYNNQMAAAAGYVAGHILYPSMEIGAAYDKAMQEYIFTPLGMNDTNFSFAEALKGNAAAPHALGINGQIEMIEQTETRGFNHTVMPYRPAGGAWSTPADMIKYVQNELTEGVGFDGVRLFAAETLLERRKPMVASGKGKNYGMGLSTNKISGIDTVRHGGSMAGYKSQMIIIPSANVGAVILTNSEQGRPLLSPFGRRLIEILYGADEKAAKQVSQSVNARDLGRKKLLSDLTIPPGPKTMVQLADRYESQQLGPLDVRREQGQVILDSGLWSTPVAEKTNPDGTTSIVFTSSLFLGMELLIGKAEGKRTLSIDDGQHKYVFVEAD